MKARIAVIAIVGALAVNAAEAKPRHHRHHIHHRATVYDANANGVIGGRPAGCPSRYCGCGLRKFLGIDDKRLDLAWNWARLFHRTSPARGAAAVRRGHVMLLVAHVSGSTWTVRNYNGGRGLSYIHERNVRGYVFVDPSNRVAMR